MKVLKFIDENLEKYFLIFLMIGVSAITCLQVFMRYVMQNSLSWSEELVRYMFIWLVCIGISYGVKKQAHIKVEAILMLVPKKAKTIIYYISDLVFLIFIIYLAKEGNAMTEQIFNLNRMSPGLKISMGYVNLALPVGCALTAIRLLQRIIVRTKVLKNGEGE